MPSPMDEESFNKTKRFVRNFSDSSHMDTLISIRKQMEETAAEKFETAAKYRDIIRDYIICGIWRYKTHV